SRGGLRGRRPFARRLIPCSSFCHASTRTAGPWRRCPPLVPWSRVVASTAAIDRWAGGGPSLRPLALIDVTVHIVGPKMRQLSLAIYELRVFSYVPIRAIPRTRPPESPGRTCPAAPRQPEITAVLKPAPSLAAQLDGTVEIPGGLLMAGPVAATVDHEQRFARVSQGKHQGMIAPLALVIDVHA